MYQLYVGNRKTPKTMIKIIFLFGSRKSKLILTMKPASDQQQMRLTLGFWETAHLPLPKSTLTLTSHLRQNFGLGEG